MPVRLVLGLKKLSYWSAWWFLAVALCCQGQEKEQNHSATAEVSFELLNGFLVVFEGRIAELHGLKFVLDTGATHSVVDRRLARKMGLRLHPKKVFDFDRSVDASEGVFPDIQFGSLQLTDVPVLAGDLSEFSTFAKGVDAIIGSDLLTLGNFTIDYDRKILRFHLPERPASLPRPRQVGMILQLQVQDHPVDLLVDTGTEGIVLFEDRLLTQIPRLVMEDEVTGIAIGRWSHATQATLPRVYLGPKAIEARVVLVKGPPGNVLPGVDGYLGTSSLKPHRIDFNIACNYFSWR